MNCIFFLQNIDNQYIGIFFVDNNEHLNITKKNSATKK